MHQRKLVYNIYLFLIMEASLSHLFYRTDVDFNFRMKKKGLLNGIVYVLVDMYSTFEQVIQMWTNQPIGERLVTTKALTSHIKSAKQKQKKKKGSPQNKKQNPIRFRSKSNVYR